MSIRYRCLKSWSGPPFKTVLALAIEVFVNSFLERHLWIRPYQWGHQWFSLPKIRQQTEHLTLFFKNRFVYIGKNFVFLQKIDWIWGMISASTTGFRIFVRSFCGLKCGSAEVLGSCLLTVHKSIKAYLSFSDGCESVIKSSSESFFSWFVKIVLIFKFFSIVEIIFPVRILLVLWVKKNGW